MQPPIADRRPVTTEHHGRTRVAEYDRLRAKGTDAVTRVLIETSDGERSWVTVGVAANVVEASWGALVDGLVFGLRKHRG